MAQRRQPSCCTDSCAGSAFAHCTHETSVPAEIGEWCAVLQGLMRCERPSAVLHACRTDSHAGSTFADCNKNSTDRGRVCVGDAHSQCTGFVAGSRSAPSACMCCAAAVIGCSERQRHRSNPPLSWRCSPDGLAQCALSHVLPTNNAPHPTHRRARSPPACTPLLRAATNCCHP